MIPTQLPHTLPNMLRVADVAAYLNVCTRVAYQIVKRPGFPLVILTNKSWRIPRDAFFAWLEEQDDFVPPAIRGVNREALRRHQAEATIAQEADRALG
jgi:hypothetical protein